MRPDDTPSDTAISLAPLIVLIGAASLLGFVPILVRLSEIEGTGPQATAFWRFIFATPGLLIWAGLASRRKLTEGPRGGHGVLILAGALFAFDLATWHAGIVRTSAANATLLANLTPIIVAAGAWLFLKERISARFAAGAALALLGAVILSRAGLGGESQNQERLLGDALSLLTAFWYASYILAVKQARRYASPVRVLLWTSLVATPIALAMTLLAGEALLPVTLLGWAWLVLLGAGVHVCGQGGLAYALGRLPAALSSVVILVQPVVAAIMGWILFGEALGGLQFAGAALVLAGIYIAQRANAVSAAAPGRARLPRFKGSGGGKSAL